MPIPKNSIQRTVPMKKIYLIRHAKSSWADGNLTDFERPLNKRGLRDAPNMGVFLKKQGVLPQLIVSSPAKRALTTANIIAKAIDYPTNNIVQNQELYVFTLDVAIVFDIIANIHNNIDRLMLFGHNPTFTALNNFLARQNYFDNIPTCGCTCWEIDTNRWADVATAKANLLFFKFPKMLL